ncbi:sulfite exporter TauE/SafE [Laceyella sediminis]|uniref:Probable membrane transporter protein n=1 Tax=Laceyella sediminis TaxID=573074 RepID=A0ABX5EUC6_9BACL|nr:sulfite exporter TauE/SafE [Laceyella sediminis]
MLTVSFTGFIVGLLVGLTGMGGGLLMTPLLILLYGFSPTMAVGTDLIYVAVTKAVGSFQHFR